MSGRVRHYHRDDAGELQTRTVFDGELDPPGVAIAVNDIYAE